MVKRVYRANVEGERRSGRPHRRWRDEVKELLVRRGLCEREEIVLARNRETWGRIGVDKTYKSISFRFGKRHVKKKSRRTDVEQNVRSIQENAGG